MFSNYVYLRYLVLVIFFLYDSCNLQVRVDTRSNYDRNVFYYIILGMFFTL